MSRFNANVIVEIPGAGLLRAAFAQHTARYVGRVLLDERGGARELLCEVADDQPWPPSPPWQELHVHEEHNGSRVLMLVGRAGTSHWSMAVSADAAQRALVFDVACRVRAVPPFLGSTFALGTALPPEISLQPLAIDDRPAAIVEQSAKRIVIRPVLDVAPPTTIRWKFSIAFRE